MQEFNLYHSGSVKDLIILCTFDCTVSSDKFHIVGVQKFANHLVNICYFFVAIYIYTPVFTKVVAFKRGR